MTAKRKVEIFSAGCPICEDAVNLVKNIACPSCDVSVLDMKQPEIAERAKKLGVRVVPAVAIDDKLAECCCGCGLDKEKLRNEGIGKPLS
jgi:glutaredoxin